MILNHKFLLFILLCWPFMSVADTSLDELITEISEQPSIELAATKYRDAFNIIANGYGTQVSSTTVESERQKMEANIEAAQTCDTSTPDNTQGPDDVTQPADATTPTDTTIPDDGKKSGDKRSDEEKQKALEEKTKAYDDAKATEQSLANRTLTAGAIATTGIGGMELAMGLSQQQADKEADENMAAYIATMRCSYADGKQVKAGPDEIELPGGNDSELMKLRTEYFALAADLKERKTALGMKPGIESEEIIDKSQTGLYDDENLGIDSGAYASLYRAQMLGSETDQTKIDEERNSSKNRVIAGGVLAGAGVIGGVVGNTLINGKLGERLKQAIAEKKVGKETQALLKKEAEALKDLQKCLDKSGVKEVDNLSFSEFYPSILSVKGIKCTPLSKWVNPTAQGLFTDTTNATNIFDTLVASFGFEIAGKMIGMSNVTSSKDRPQAIQKVEQLIKDIQKKFDDAAEKDKEAADKAGISIGNVADTLKDSGLANKANLFSGFDFDASTGGTGFLSTFMNK